MCVSDRMFFLSAKPIHSFPKDFLWLSLNVLFKIKEKHMKSLTRLISTYGQLVTTLT